MSSLTKDLLRLEQDVLRMGALVEDSCWLAHAALFERDLERALLLKEHDREVDRFYRQIERDCLEAMGLHAPVSRQLRVLGAYMQLVRDLERIGDYAKNLGEIAAVLFRYPPFPHQERLETMSNRCRAMLAMSLGVLSDLDAARARDIKVKDDAVDRDYRELYALLAASRWEGLLEPMLQLVLALHHLERIADHCTNIGQRVSFIVTGTR